MQIIKKGGFAAFFVDEGKMRGGEVERWGRGGEEELGGGEEELGGGGE